ncbi:hypothetical protein D3C87_1805680 [compost metagenome]
MCDGPAGRLTASLAKHPFTDGQDGAAFLRNRYEICRRNEASLRMTPAQQHLVTGDLSRGNRLLDLIIQVKLLLLDGDPKLLRHLGAVTGGLIHFHVVEAHLAG